jgi:hypothetical protein
VTGGEAATLELVAADGLKDPDGNIRNLVNQTM